MGLANADVRTVWIWNAWITERNSTTETKARKGSCSPTRVLWQKQEKWNWCSETFTTQAKLIKRDANGVTSASASVTDSHKRETNLLGQQ